MTRPPRIVDLLSVLLTPEERCMVRAGIPRARSMPRRERVRTGPAPSRTARRASSPPETVVVLRDAEAWYRVTALDDAELELAVSGFSPLELVLRLEAERPHALMRYLHRRFDGRRLTEDWFALTADDLGVIRMLPDDEGLNALFGVMRLVPPEERRRVPRVGPITVIELEAIRARLEVRVRKHRIAEREMLFARATGANEDEHARRTERRVMELEREIADLEALVRQAISVDRDAAANRRSTG